MRARRLLASFLEGDVSARTLRTRAVTMTESTMRSIAPNAAGTAGAVPRRTGSTVGSYRIERLLSEGGFASVYEARHMRLGRRAALKAPLEQYMDCPELLDVIRKEATILTQIEHENVVRLLDFDEDDQGPFLVLEYFDGETVADRLARTGPFPVQEAVRIVSEVARALEDVHSHGIVHCDVKPANVFLVPARRGPDQVKILDFGISVKPGDELGTDAAPSSPSGTPSYMAPEQAQGATPVDHRADQFALAVMAYELLSGKKAFAGATFRTLVTLKAARLPPICDAVSELSESFDAVLQRATSSRREDRYDDIAAFAHALEDAARDTASAGPRSTVAPESGVRQIDSGFGWKTQPVTALSLCG
jgi:serine/threonine-protein kinase